MEVFPVHVSLLTVRSSLLHVRGGVSASRMALCVSLSVFSTYVEVFLPHSLKNRVKLSLLHVRGGVSRDMINMSLDFASSPRTWRCFCRRLLFDGRIEVFSTYVEVFL